MGRPRLHDDETRRRLLAAAETLLAEGGAESLSIRAVAEAAGATPRAIYSVFGNKEGLLDALFSEAFEALAADLDALPLTDDPVADLVAAGAAGFRGWAQARPELFRLAFAEDLSVSDAAREASVMAFGRLRARIRRCIDADIIAKDAEVDLGLAFHALCEGLASLERRGRFPPLAQRTAQAMWRSALTGLVNGFRA